MMIVAIVCAILLIPLWMYNGAIALIALGAFGMQFMVQGAWGIIPAHINELSPGSLRGFFPGFAYQLGVLIASSVAYVEAVLAGYLDYTRSMEILAGSVLVLGVLVIWLGPEARGVDFHPSGDGASS